jgi:hypothetical protein
LVDGRPSVGAGSTNRRCFVDTLAGTKIAPVPRLSARLGLVVFLACLSFPRVQAVSLGFILVLVEVRTKLGGVPPACRF